MVNILSVSDLENMTHSTLVCSMTISLTDEIFGDDKHHEMCFDVFDGFAHCNNCEGKEYYMDYPKLELVKKSKRMQDSIREFMGLGDNDEIKITDIMCAYYDLKCNGVVNN